MNKFSFSRFAAAMALPVMVLMAGACTAAPAPGPPVPTATATRLPESYTGPCMPPPVSMNVATAKRGTVVKLAAKDAQCRPRYGKNAQIEVTVLDSKGDLVFSGLGPMTDDGGFTFSFQVPEGSALGKAVVSATPYGVDSCDDTGGNNRLGASPAAAAAGASELQRADCIRPMLALTILPQH